MKIKFGVSLPRTLSADMLVAELFGSWGSFENGKVILEVSESRGEFFESTLKKANVEGSLGLTFHYYTSLLRDLVNSPHELNVGIAYALWRRGMLHENEPVDVEEILGVFDIPFVSVEFFHRLSAGDRISVLYRLDKIPVSGVNRSAIAKKVVDVMGRMVENNLETFADTLFSRWRDTMFALFWKCGEGTLSRRERDVFFVWCDNRERSWRKEQWYLAMHAGTPCLACLLDSLVSSQFTVHLTVDKLAGLVSDLSLLPESEAVEAFEDLASLLCLLGWREI